MFDLLQPADKPVVEGLEGHEIVYAKDQPEYTPLRVIRGNTDAVQVLSRWTLTMQQRAEIAGGADIYLELLLFRDKDGKPRPLTPIRMAIGDDVDPDFIRMEYQLPDLTGPVR